MYITVYVEGNSHKTQLNGKIRNVKLETISTSEFPAAYEQTQEKVHQKFNKKGGELRRRLLREWKQLTEV